MNSQLQKLADEFYLMKDEAGKLLRNTTDKKFNQRPDNGGWSAAECIDHLVATGADYCDQYEKALRLAMEKGCKLNGELKNSWFGQRFINFVEPPVRFKAKSPKKWKPASSINLAKVTAAYLQLQDRYIDLLSASEGWDISKVKLPSPATNLIKFSAYEMMGINAAHQRRHFAQAKKAMGLK
jgi:hypothetical protein